MTALFRVGYVAITGLPNTGKSTLLNRVVGEGLAIVTPKPQTTRNRIVGILQREDAQAVFVDTPGVCDEISELNKYLNREIGRAIDDADVVLMVADSAGRNRESEDLLVRRLGESKHPMILALNKIDTAANRAYALPRIEALSKLASFEEIFPISAATGEGVEALTEALLSRLPGGQPLFPQDELSTANLRFFVAELIREQVFMKTQDEIPYSTAVLIDSFKEPTTEGGLYRIEAEIAVEREGQKGIVIGAGGRMLKSIGQSAREKIEAFLGGRVYLGLKVKVRRNWAHDERLLRHVGYH